MTSDVPNAFIQTDVHAKEVGERVIMKIHGKLVDWLVDLDPGKYENLVVIENHQKVIYLLIQKAIYGMLEALLLWYRKFKKYLELQGFVFNAYVACVANRIRNNTQHNIRFHIDDILSSHVD